VPHQLVQGTRLAKLGSELQNLGIKRRGWTGKLFSRKVSHGVSSVALVGPLVKLKPNQITSKIRRLFLLSQNTTFGYTSQIDCL
jgi:hypothetical protein